MIYVLNVSKNPENQSFTYVSYERSQSKQTDVSEIRSSPNIIFLWLNPLNVQHSQTLKTLEAKRVHPPNSISC